MENKEIALQLTLKAMETGLIPAKPLNHCKSDDPFKESTDESAECVAAFYRQIYRAVNKGAAP